MSICYDCIKAPAPEATPCDGYIVNVFDVNTGETYKIRPTIAAGKYGTYKFSLTINGTDFTIYSRDGGDTWEFMYNAQQVAWSTSSDASAPCPSLSGWSAQPGVKYYVTSIDAAVVPTPGEPAKAGCSPSINVPDLINLSTDYKSALESFNNCFISKGTTYYNKIAGGVHCDNRELAKLNLILRLLNEYDCEGRALECIYNHTAFPAAKYSPYQATVGLSSTATKGIYNLVSTEGYTNDLSRFVGFTISVPEGANEAHSFTILTAVFNELGNVTEITISPDYEYEYVELTVDLTNSITSTAYLDSFINFANKFCLDCITTPAVPSTGATKQPGKGPENTSLTTAEDLLRFEETGVPVELESLQTINLI